MPPRSEPPPEGRLSRLQAEQIRRCRGTGEEAGHDWTPRMSVSRSIFPIVSETDRSLFSLRGEDSHDYIDVTGFFVCEGVVGVGGCQWFGVLESCAAVRGGVWSYLASRGRTLEGF